MRPALPPAHTLPGRTQRTRAAAVALAWGALAAAVGALFSSAAPAAPLAPPAPPLPAVAAQPAATGSRSAYEAVVEAVRMSVVAAQVPGAVVDLQVKVGDRVQAGQVLLRLDARAAQQNAQASEAQVQAARAALALARQDLDRQRQLFQTQFISRAAFDHAEAQFQATQAQAQAQLAQAGAAQTQAAFHVVRAPFAGVVSEVPVALGDMALPGRALLTLYDPGALRVTAAVPQAVASRLAAGTTPRLQFPGLAEAQQWVQPLRVQWLPTVDPATHTVQVRADLPPGTPALAPGVYARLWLPATGEGLGAAGDAPVRVPGAAVVRRAELTALYVLDDAGQPLLRQVRLGRAEAGQVEVLSGLRVGERVVTDPQAAARVPVALR